MTETPRMMANLVRQLLWLREDMTRAAFFAVSACGGDPSAGTNKKLDELLDFLQEFNWNEVVQDDNFLDRAGVFSWEMLRLIKELSAKIPDLSVSLNELHRTVRMRHASNGQGENST